MSITNLGKSEVREMDSDGKFIGDFLHRRVGRKAFLRGAAKGAAGLLLAGSSLSLLEACAPKAAAPAGIRLADQPALCCVPYFVAKAKGWFTEEFEKDGIEVKFATFLAGPPMIESFAGGGQDIGLFGDTPPIIAKSENIDIKVVASSLRGPEHVAILVPSNSLILSPKDLRDNKVGVTKGSNAHHLLAEVLRRNGLTVADISLVHLLPPDGKAAFDTGQIDAWAVWTPWIERVELAGGRVLVDAKGIKLGSMVVGAREEFAQKYPDLVERYLNVLEKAANWAEKYPQEAQRIVTQELKVPEEVVAKAWPKVTDWHPRLTKADTADLQKVADFLQETGIIRRKVDVEKELIDQAFYQK